MASRLRLAKHTLSLCSTSSARRTRLRSWNGAGLARGLHGTEPIVEDKLPVVEASSSAIPAGTDSGALRAYNGGYPPKTRQCADIGEADDGQYVVVTGWLQTIRKLKGLSFFVLRDYSGTIQLFYREQALHLPHRFDIQDFPPESVVSIEGTVRSRPSTSKREGAGNEVEIIVNKYVLLNPAERPLPFYPAQWDNLPSADFRNKFRYLELRRKELASNIRKRSKVTRVIRDVLDNEGFLDVETPILLNSTPEGAREFLVPTRLRPLAADDAPPAAEGSAPSDTPTFYALAQSPQQPKQLLICSGAVEKYYQFAKCFRDEDGRKDRQPEFTQLDMEMAFVSWEAGEREIESGWRMGGVEVKDVVEKIVRRMWKDVEEVDLPEIFPVMTYNEAMTKYGSDKPDTRIPLEIVDLTESMPEEIRTQLRSPKSTNCTLHCLRVPKSPFRLKAYRDILKQVAPNGNIIPAFVRQDTTESWLPPRLFSGEDPVSFSPEIIKALNKSLGTRPSDHMFFEWRPSVPSGGSTALGALRLALAEQAQATRRWTPPPEPHFLWVTEFPLFAKDDEKAGLVGGEWSSSHHPFTAPMAEDLELLMQGVTPDLGKVRGQHYDLVLNGVEIGGGSVRIHDAHLQEWIMREILQLDEAQLSKFNHLLQALRSGAPPHAGIALGFDRLMSLLCNTPSIREVITFPKTADGRDPLFGSPSTVPTTALTEYFPGMNVGGNEGGD